MNKIFRFIWAAGLIVAFISFAPVKAKAAFQMDSLKKVAIQKINAKLPKVKVPAVPKIPVDLKKIDTPKLKPPGLLKKLSQDLVKALQFRKNFQAKEKVRVIKMVDSLVIQNPQMAKAQDLTKLRKNLSDTTKQLYNDLVVRLLALQKEVKVLADTSQDSVKNQQTINTLISKMVPMLKSVENDQTVNLSRQKRIQVVRKLFGQPPGKTDTARLNDTLKLVYHLKLKHRIPVFGYISAQNQNDGANYNYEILSGDLFSIYQLDPYSGFVRDFSNPHTAAVFKQAVANKNNVFLSFYYDGASIGSFLNNKYSQATFNATLLKYLRDMNVNGANIFFSNVAPAQQKNFTLFIQNLYRYCKSNYPGFQLAITLPGLGNNGAYNLKELNPCVSFFILDFSKNYTGKPGPIAPLSGYKGNNIQSAISRFTNTGILPAKFMLCLPYQGIQYTFVKPAAAGKNPIYLPYKDIRAKFNNAFYNLDSTVAFSTQTDKRGVTDTVWFDDENTLAKKYDYITLAGLGGVVVKNLEDGDGYGELWDVLTDKFMDFDTLRVKTINNSHHPAKITFWQSIEKYYYLFNKPCDTEFDSDMQAMLKIPPKKNRAYFQQTVKDALFALHVANVILLVILIIGIVVLVRNIRLEGDFWPWKRLLTGILIVIVHLFILTVFMALYLDEAIPLFGRNNTGGCINMPFHDLLLIIVFGLLAGMLIMRFLIFPFIKKEDVP